MEHILPVCHRFQVSPHIPDRAEKVGFARSTIGLFPVHALRILPAGGTSGWYIWAGGEMSSDPDFFQPLHISHLDQYCPEIMPYLGLPPGWRVLLAPNHEDVWFDAGLIGTEPSSNDQ